MPKNRYSEAATWKSSIQGSPSFQPSKNESKPKPQKQILQILTSRVSYQTQHTALTCPTLKACEPISLPQIIIKTTQTNIQTNGPSTETFQSKPRQEVTTDCWLPEDHLALESNFIAISHSKSHSSPQKDILNPDHQSERFLEIAPHEPYSTQQNHPSTLPWRVLLHSHFSSTPTRDQRSTITMPHSNNPSLASLKIHSSKLASSTQKKVFSAQRLQNFLEDMEPHSTLRDISTWESDALVVKAAGERIAHKIFEFESVFNSNSNSPWRKITLIQNRKSSTPLH